MCDSSVYILKEGKEQLVLEGVDSLESTGNSVRAVDIFGEEKVLKARIKSLSLLDHKIVLEPL